MRHLARLASCLLGVLLLGPFSLVPMRASADGCTGCCPPDHDIDDITTWDLFVEPYTGELHGLHGPGVIDARLYSPESCDPLPLVIYFHGNQKPPFDFDEQLDPVPNLVHEIGERGLYLLAPHFDKIADRKVLWSYDTVDATWRIVDQVMQLYNIDPDRIYVTGWSDGGFATFLSMERHGDRVAAAAPISAAPNSLLPYTGWWIETSYYIGELDPDYMNGSWDLRIAAQADAGNDTITKTIFPGLAHETAVWNGTYGLDSFYTWMLGITRYPCADGLDDDGDGWVDYVPDANGDGIGEYPGDPSCTSPRDSRETTACQDGIDNDGDGTMDFDGGASWNNGIPQLLPDHNCLGRPWRNCETARCAPIGCGLGAELALVVPLLWVWRTRRRRRSAV